MRRLSLALALCLLGAPALARPKPTPRAAVSAALSRIDRAPTKKELLAASPEAPEVLRALAVDPDVPPWTRGRAIAALGHFPSPDTRNTLRSVLRDHERPDLMRSRALLSMARGFGDPSVPEVAAYLSDRSSVLQDSAADALGRLGTAKAKAALRRALDRTRDPALQGRIREAILGRAPARGPDR